MDPYAETLADAVDGALPEWVERSVGRLVTAWQGGAAPSETVMEAARRAGEAARIEVGGRLRQLLALDVDAQPTSPLAVLRGAVTYPTSVLRDAGVPSVVRDDFRERSFPDDVYDLAPATWADIDGSLQEPGLVWSAFKAKTVLDRRRAEGRR